MLNPGMAVEIARRFDLGAGAELSAGPVARGKEGLVWRLDTVRGRWAVKEPVRQVPDEQVAAAALFQETVGKAGVPVPQVVRSVDGTVFAAVGGTWVRVYGWVDLLAPDIAADPVAVGELVAGIHRVRMSIGEEFVPWYGEAVGAQRWDALVTDLRRAKAPFAEDLAQVRDELIALEEWIEPPESLQTCHRDLWADNLVGTPSGGLCVIDWDNSGLADPAQELCCVLFEFGAGSPGRARSLYEAYRNAGGPARVERPGHFSMLIAELGHICEMACRDWLQPNPRSPERADSAASFAEFVDRPHHRDVLLEILDAIT